MKKFNPKYASKIGYYLYSLARNLLNAKRDRRICRPDFEYGMAVGRENEAHNRYYAAKQYFLSEENKYE